MDRLVCDVGVCTRSADVLITFYGQRQEWPYCVGHAFNRDGTLRWRGKVERVENVADEEPSRFDEASP